MSQPVARASACLCALTRSVVGRTVTLQQLRELAQAVTHWYRRHGYVTTRAVVPAQTVEAGVVRVRVVEGRVGQIRVEGNRHVSAKQIERTLGVASGQLLRLPALESGLIRLNAHPDRTVRVVLAQGLEPGGEIDGVSVHVAGSITPSNSLTVVGTPPGDVIFTPQP
jgi:hemolysin activation/secretion protein